jgi:transposase
MSGKRYTDEFKAEAVRFVTERGHSAREVAARLGISEHSMYRWLREAGPPVEEQQAQDLAEAQNEIKRLKRDLQRTREERDILKKAAAYFIKDPD